MALLGLDSAMHVMVKMYVNISMNWSALTCSKPSSCIVCTVPQGTSLPHLCMGQGTLRRLYVVLAWCWHSGVKAYRVLGEIWGSDIYHLIPGNLVDFFVSWWLFEKLSLYFSVSIENKQRQAWCLVRPRDHLEALILVVLVSCLSPVQTTCVWICNLLLYTNLPVPVIKCANMDLFCSQGGDET